MKKCWNTLDPVQEPADCIGEACSAWKNTKTFTGCVFIIEAQSTALVNILALTRDQATKVEPQDTDDKQVGDNEKE